MMNDYPFPYQLEAASIAHFVPTLSVRLIWRLEGWTHIAPRSTFAYPEQVYDPSNNDLYI